MCHTQQSCGWDIAYTVQSPAVQKGVSLKCSSFTKIFLGYPPMINGNAVSLKWQTYHRHMVNTGDWQLFSILHGRQDGLGHVWGQPRQWHFRVPRQNGTDLKLMNSLVFYYMELNEKNQYIISFHCALVLISLAMFVINWYCWTGV